MTDEETLHEEAILLAAQAAYQATVVYNVALGEPGTDWYDVPEQKRDTLIAGVRMIVGDPDTTAETLWRAPSLGSPRIARQYSELPMSEKSRGDLFITVARGVYSFYTVEANHLAQAHGQTLDFWVNVRKNPAPRLRAVTHGWRCECLNINRLSDEECELCGRDRPPTLSGELCKCGSGLPEYKGVCPQCFDHGVH